MKFIRNPSEEPSLNLTPLVDIMFILILFLVVTAQYSKLTTIKVSLPKVSSAGQPAEPKSWVVSLFGDGSIALNGENMTEEGLREKLQRGGEETAHPSVILQADTDSRSGQMVHLMDMIRGAGIQKISIEALKNSTPP